MGGQRVAATLHCTTKEDQPLHRCYRKTRCIDALRFSLRFFRFCWPVSIWTTLCHSIIVLNHGEQFAPVGMLQLLHHKGTTLISNQSTQNRNPHTRARAVGMFITKWCLHASVLVKTKALKIIRFNKSNISPTKAPLKMIFPFPRWDMLVPWRVLVLRMFCCQ